MTALLEEARAKLDAGIMELQQQAAEAKADADAARADDAQDAEYIADLELAVAEREAEIARLQAIIDADDNNDLTVAQQYIGIQVFHDRNSYLDYEGTFQMLKFLGIKKVRSNIGPGTKPEQIAYLNRLHDELGITFCLTVGQPRVVLTATQWTAVERVVSEIRGIDMLCNWNEPNNKRKDTDPTLDGWIPKTVRHGYELMKRFAELYVIGSAQLWSGSINRHNAELQALSEGSIVVNGQTVWYEHTFEAIVWHLYQPGETIMESYVDQYTGYFGDLPIVCSETGMSTAPNQEQGALSMPNETEHAAYLKGHLNMYVSRGMRVYLFETRDDENPSGTDREKWLGQFRADGTPKESAHMLKELLAA